MPKVSVSSAIQRANRRKERKINKELLHHLKEMVGVWEFVCSGYGFDPEHMQQYVAAKAFLDEQNKENRYD